MKNKAGSSKISSSIFLVCLTFLLCMLPALGMALERPAFAVDRMSFDQALREDRLTLVPMGEIEFGNGERPLSLSPDGEKLLLLSDDGLSVGLLADGTRTPLAPREGNSHLTEEQILKLFATPEATGMSWSADGRYLSFSFPANAYMRMMAYCNVWIADLETGVIDPLLDLPEGISVPDLHGENPPDIPVRAAFDPSRPVLYFDLLSAYVAGEDKQLLNRYFQLDYEGNEISPIGDTPYDMISGDPRLWRIGSHLVTTVASNSGLQGGVGIASMIEKESPKLMLEKERFLAAFLYCARLIAAYERDAILYQQGNGYEMAYGSGESHRRIMHLMDCSLNDQGEAQYGAFLAMDTDAPAQSRLLRFSADELDDGEINAALLQRYMRDEVNVCYNAAFSPDGGYLLLAAQGLGGSKGLYVLNRATGECGRILLPEDFEAAMDARALRYEVGPNRLPGIQWSAGDRLLLFDGNMNRLYTLAAQP